jgi:hypothetical protein
VDQILYTSFGVHPIAGLAVLVGSMLLVLPALVGWVRDPRDRLLYGALGSVWLTAIVAAALGNYPTPVVGYGGSAIIGYVLALAALGTSASRSSASDVAEQDTQVTGDEQQMLRTLRAV